MISNRPPPIDPPLPPPGGNTESNITWTERWGEWPDVTIFMILKDGTWVLNHPGGSVTWIYPDGSKSGRDSDGSTWQKDKDGTYTRTNADGSKVEVRPDGAQTNSPAPAAPSH